MQKKKKKGKTKESSPKAFDKRKLKQLTDTIIVKVPKAYSVPSQPSDPPTFSGKLPEPRSESLDALLEKRRIMTSCRRVR